MKISRSTVVFYHTECSYVYFMCTMELQIQENANTNQSHTDNIILNASKRYVHQSIDICLHVPCASTHMVWHHTLNICTVTNIGEIITGGLGNTCNGDIILYTGTQNRSKSKVVIWPWGMSHLLKWWPFERSHALAMFLSPSLRYLDIGRLLVCIAL